MLHGQFFQGQAYLISFNLAVGFGAWCDGFAAVTGHFTDTDIECFNTAFTQDFHCGNFAGFGCAYGTRQIRRHPYGFAIKLGDHITGFQAAFIGRAVFLHPGDQGAVGVFHGEGFGQFFGDFLNGNA